MKSRSTNDGAIHVCLIIVRSFATCTYILWHKRSPRQAPTGVHIVTRRLAACVELSECFPVLCHPISERALLCLEVPWLRPLVLLIIVLRLRWVWSIGTMILTGENCPLIDDDKFRFLHCPNWWMSLTSIIAISCKIGRKTESVRRSAEVLNVKLGAAVCNGHGVFKDWPHIAPCRPYSNEGDIDRQLAQLLGTLTDQYSRLCETCGFITVNTRVRHCILSQISPFPFPVLLASLSTVLWT
jgi:hypothetical protein